MNPQQSYKDIIQCIDFAMPAKSKKLIQFFQTMVARAAEYEKVMSQTKKEDTDTTVAPICE